MQQFENNLPSSASSFIARVADDGLLDISKTVRGDMWWSIPLMSNPKVYVSFYRSEMDEIVMFLGTVDNGFMYHLIQREDLAPSNFKYNYASWASDFKLGHDTAIGWLREIHALNTAEAN